MPSLLCALLLAAAPASPAEAAPLPLTALVLYENGLGYFERRGVVGASEVAPIPLEPGQLDDALQSLVLVSRRGIAAVEFAPPLAPEAARAVAGMPEPGNQASLPALLRALVGVEVAVDTSGPLRTGRIIEVAEEQKLDRDGKPLPAPALLLFGKAGLFRVPLDQIRAVRPLDSSVQLAWERATGSQATQAEQQCLRIRGGQGGGEVAVGYTTEAPVWRTTYRLVFGSEAPRLQGFALVHNDSDEPWAGVRVTLASGRPNSFLFPLAGPRYTRRELVSPEDGLDSAPQLTSAEARDHLRGGATVSLTGESMGMGGYGSGSGAYGAVASHHVAAAIGSGTVDTTAPSDLLQEGPTPLEPAAVSEAGELFLYTVKEPVFLGARRSALLPIVDSPTGAEAVTLVGNDGKVALAMRITNTTGLTLEGGTIAIFTQGAYAGEAQLDRLKPGEVRIVRHGDDLDVTATQTDETTPGPVKQVRTAHGLIELHRIDRITHTVEVMSRSDHSRTLLVELPREGYRLISGGEEDVRSPGQPRYARLSFAAHESRQATLVEEGRVVEKLSPEKLSTHRLDELLSSSLEPGVRAALLVLRGNAQRAEQAQQRGTTALERIKQLEGDRAQLRENLAAAGKGGAKDAAAEMADRLLKLDDELGRLRGDVQQSAKTTAEAYQALLAST